MSFDVFEDLYNLFQEQQLPTFSLGRPSAIQEGEPQYPCPDFSFRSDRHYAASNSKIQQQISTKATFHRHSLSLHTIVTILWSLQPTFRICKRLFHSCDRHHHPSSKRDTAPFIYGRVEHLLLTSKSIATTLAEAAEEQCLNTSIMRERRQCQRRKEEIPTHQIARMCVAFPMFAPSQDLLPAMTRNCADYLFSVRTFLRKPMIPQLQRRWNDHDHSPSKSLPRLRALLHRKNPQSSKQTAIRSTRKTIPSKQTPHYLHPTDHLPHPSTIPN